MRVGAGVLLRDPIGRVLLVEPTYKRDWEIPGGLVEQGESPREAAHRECLEELGIDLAVRDLLCVHHVEGAQRSDGGIMFVFDAGTVTLSCDDLRLPPEELRSARFVPVDELAAHLLPIMVKRITAAIAAASEGSTAYLER